jgi:hypothetical protein
MAPKSATINRTINFMAPVTKARLLQRSAASLAGGYGLTSCARGSIGRTGRPRRSYQIEPPDQLREIDLFQASVDLQCGGAGPTCRP